MELPRARRPPRQRNLLQEQFNAIQSKLEYPDVPVSDNYITAEINRLNSQGVETNYPSESLLSISDNTDLIPVYFKTRYNIPKWFLLYPEDAKLVFEYLSNPSLPYPDIDIYDPQSETMIPLEDKYKPSTHPSYHPEQQSIESLVQQLIQNQQQADERIRLLTEALERQEALTRKYEERGRRHDKSPERLHRIREYDEILNPELAVSQRIEELVSKTRSETLNKHQQEPDYDTMNWTWSLTYNEPVYFHPSTPLSKIEELNLMITPSIEARLQSPALRQRYANPNQIDYSRRLPTNVLPIVKQELSQASPISTEIIANPSTIATQRQLGQAMRAIPNLNTITYIPNLPFRAQHLTPEMYKEMYPDDDRIGYLLNTNSRFAGVLTTYDVNIQTPIFTLPQYQYIVTHVLREQSVTDALSSPSTAPIFWVLQAYFTAYDPDTGEQIAQRRISYWHGISETDNPIDFKQLGDTMESMLENLGYSADKTAANLHLDITRFTIKRIDVNRTGAGRIKTKGKTIQDITQLINTKRKGLVKLDWAKVEVIQHAYQACFAAALGRYLRIKGVMPAGSRYTELFKLIPMLGELEGRHVYTEEAKIITNSIGLDIEIYDENGLLIVESQAIEYEDNVLSEKVKLLSSGDRVLRLMHVPDHYLLIHELYDRPVRQPVTKASGRVNSYYEIEIVYYDIETVLDSVGMVIPYANAYIIGDREKIDVVKKPSYNIFANMMMDIQMEGPCKHWFLAAYNGSRFDHIVFFQFVVESGYQIISEPNPSGSSHAFTFAISTVKSGEWIEERFEELVVERGISENDKERKKLMAELKKGVSYVSVWDPVLFIRKPLAGAAEDFKVENKKLGFDHKEVKRAFNEGMLGEWIDENYEKLRRYNIMDVVVMKQVVEKLFDAILRITGIGWKRLVKMPSISNMAYRWWREIIVSEVNTSGSGRDKNLLKYVAVRSRSYDEIVRESMIAGRVEGMVGDWKFPRYVVMIDVVSLYPTMMKTDLFPEGYETVVFDQLDGRNYYMDRVPGIYYISWNQENLRGLHPILPVRGGTLDWSEASSGEGYVCSVTIMQLRRYVCDVKFVEAPLRKIKYVMKVVDEVKNSDYEISQEDIDRMVWEGVDVRVEGDKAYYMMEKRVQAIVWKGTVNKIKDTIDNMREWSRETKNPNTKMRYERKIRELEKEVDSVVDESPFRAFIVKLEEDKNLQDEYASKEDDRFNATVREVDKIIMNANSGKVAQRNFKKRYKLVYGGSELRKQLDLILGVDKRGRYLDKKGIEEIDPEYITTVDGVDIGFVTWNDESYDRRSAKPSQLAVFIYALARAYMYDNVFSKMKVLYSDTDSALIELEDYDALIDEELKCNYVDDELNVVTTRKKKFGDYEIEVDKKTKIGVYNRAIILGPKSYALIRDGNVIKWKFKGIRREDKWELDGEWLSISKDPLRFFLGVLANRELDRKTKVKTKVFGKSWGKGSILGVNIHNVIKELD